MVLLEWMLFKTEKWSHFSKYTFYIPKIKRKNFLSQWNPDFSYFLWVLKTILSIIRMKSLFNNLNYMSNCLSLQKRRKPNQILTNYTKLRILKTDYVRIWEIYYFHYSEGRYKSLKPCQQFLVQFSTKKWKS